jgi:hypothetical protein
MAEFERPLIRRFELAVRADAFGNHREESLGMLAILHPTLAEGARESRNGHLGRGAPAWPRGKIIVLQVEYRVRVSHSVTERLDFAQEFGARELSKSSVSPTVDL